MLGKKVCNHLYLHSFLTLEKSMKIRVLDCATLGQKGNCCCYFQFVFEATYLRPQYKQIAILQVTK